MTVPHDWDVDEPVAVDDSEVLATINEVRVRVGWEPLSHIPTGDPNHGCRCVFGQAWCMSIDPHGRNDAAEQYEKVYITSRTGGPNGSLIDAIADVCGGDVTTHTDWSDASDHPAVELPGQHPLMRWMFQFDTHMRPELVDDSVNDPLAWQDEAYKDDFTQDQR